MKDEKRYYQCICAGEIISIETWYDEQEVAISIYKHTASHYTWRSRLSYIWQIIKNGHPYSDCLILDKEDFKQFKEFINTITI